MRKEIIASILMGSLVFAPVAFAGNPGQGGQSGQAGQAGQCGQHQGHHGCGIVKSIKKAFVKGYKAGKKAAIKTGDAVQNKVMDTGVAVKKAVTGKKPKTFVKGHYNKNGSHTQGHFRKVGGK
jgi:hypothetical protein